MTLSLPLVFRNNCYLEALRFQSCVSSSCRLLSRSEEGSQGRSELFCGSRGSSERSGDPYSSSSFGFFVFFFSASYSSRPRLPESLPSSQVSKQNPKWILRSVSSLSTAPAGARTAVNGEASAASGVHRAKRAVGRPPQRRLPRARAKHGRRQILSTVLW